MALASEEIPGERFWQDPETARFATIHNVAGPDWVEIILWRPCLSEPGKWEAMGIYAFPSVLLSALALHLVKKAGELAARTQTG